MARDKPLRLEEPGVLELLQDYDALRTWEAIRGFRSVVTLSELEASLAIDRRTLQAQVDRLTDQALLKVVRARKPRTSVGYRVATDRIVVTFDDSDPRSVEHAMASSRSVGDEFKRCVDRYADPEFDSKAGVRFRQHTMQHFTVEDFAELRRRILAVVEFLATPRPRPSQPTRSGNAKGVRPAFCNQSISIFLEPLVGELLPLPAVWMTPHSKLSRADRADSDRTGIRGLAPREREVAFALADGLTRAHAAERMGISVHTVATITRRIYRKLGVSSQAGLAARLAGVARRDLGEG